MPELIQQQAPDLAGNIFKGYQFGQQAKTNQLQLLAAQQEFDINKAKFAQTQAENILSETASTGDQNALQRLAGLNPARAEGIRKQQDYNDVQGARILDSYSSMPQYAFSQKKWEQMHNEYFEATGKELPLPSDKSPEAILEFKRLSSRLKGREQDLKEQYQSAQIRTEGLQQSKYGVDIQKGRQDLQKGALDIMKSRGELLSAEEERTAARGQGLTLGAFKKQQEEVGKVKGEKTALLQSASSKLPQLLETVNKLSKLGQTATYTAVGVGYDTAARELGLPVPKGAIARREYVATVDNEILPLLRDTFGAQFTQKEGESLKETLGDTGASPQEKEAVLRSFIETKINSLNSNARELGIEPLNPTIVSKGKYSVVNGKIIEEGRTATNPQTGQRVVFRGGQWQSQ
jgi:hypothetical protein